MPKRAVSGASRWLGKDPIIAIASVVIAVAAAASLWFGLTLAESPSEADLAVSDARTDAIAQGGRAIITLNTLDHRSAKEGLARWEAQSSGLLHEQIKSSRRDILRAVEQRRTTTTATIVQAALTELDGDRARLMSVVDVTVRPASGRPATKRARLLGELQRADGRWKLAALLPVHVEP